MEIITLNKQNIGYHRLTACEQEVLFKLCVDDEFQRDYSSLLVGVAFKQIFVSKLNEVQELIQDKVSEFLYFIELNRDFKVQSCWYNIMKPGDFNPLHDHAGDLSFIVIFDQEENLIQEQKRDNHSGHLWFYSASSEGHISGISALTGGGHFYIFKLSLDHIVYPFKSQTLRYSLAGNISLQ